VCQSCDKTFIQLLNLYEHEFIHTQNEFMSDM